MYSAASSRSRRAGAPPLPGGAEDPFLSHLLGNLLMWDGATSLEIREAAVYGLDDIEMIEDVLNGAFVGKTIEQLADGVLGLQDRASGIKLRLNILHPGAAEGRVLSSSRPVEALDPGQ